METSISIVDPASSYALASLDDIKLSLGSTDDSEDALLQALLDQNSGVIATLCNRVFGKESLIETFSDIASNRVYLSRYPVLADDITSVTSNAIEITDYVLDEPSGKITLTTSYSYPVVVAYSGGYDLPDNGPLALKRAVLLLTRNDLATSGGSASSSLINSGGVRMISHKNARIMYYQASESSGSTASTSGGTSAFQRTVDNLIVHFIRHWV